MVKMTIAAAMSDATTTIGIKAALLIPPLLSPLDESSDDEDWSPEPARPSYLPLLGVPDAAVSEATGADRVEVMTTMLPADVDEKTWVVGRTALAVSEAAFSEASGEAAAEEPLVSALAAFC